MKFEQTMAEDGNLVEVRLIPDDQEEERKIGGLKKAKTVLILPSGDPKSPLRLLFLAKGLK